QEIALDAVQAAVDLGLDVAMGGDHAAVVDRDVDAAAGSAVAARRLAPLQPAVALHHRLGDLRGKRQPGRRGGAGDGAVADELAAAGTHRNVSCGAVPGTAVSAGGCGSMWW